jgi:hypothetical protein
MIEQITDTKIFLDICDKLDDVPDCKLSKKSLYSFMISGEYNKRVFVYANFDGEMNGCEVIALNNDLNGVLTLSVIFLWISPRHRKLWKEYMKFTEKRAIQYKCKKISFTTSRSEKAIDKHLGKHGYYKVYNVIEKEIKEVS